MTFARGLFTISNGAILFPFIGVLHGLTLSPSGEELMRRDNNTIPATLFVLGIGMLVLSYGAAILDQGYSGFIDDYIFSSMNITVPFVTGLIIWNARNLYYSIFAFYYSYAKK